LANNLVPIYTYDIDTVCPGNHQDMCKCLVRCKSHHLYSQGNTQL